MGRVLWDFHQECRGLSPWAWQWGLQIRLHLWRHQDHQHFLLSHRSCRQTSLVLVKFFSPKSNIWDKSLECSRMGMFLTLISNIRLGWKDLQVTNALAFVSASSSSKSNIWDKSLECTRMLHSTGMFLTLISNIRLGWKDLQVTNFSAFESASFFTQF